MSLLTTASPWTNDDSQQNKKRTSTMRNTIKNIQPYAPSESNQEINENNLEPPSIQESQSNHENRNVKINDLLGKMSLSIDNDGNKLGNFSPPEKPIVNMKKPDMYDKTGGKNEMSPYDLMPKHNGSTHDSHTGMNPYTAPNKTNTLYRANESTGALGAYNNYNASYDTNNISYKPYYAKMGGNTNMPLDNRLLEKINYMIHLLEEQQVEKSSNITEEFILYTFLGIFVIFVVDSFSRSGKYIR